jgi:hypothetical protein
MTSIGQRYIGACCTRSWQVMAQLGLSSSANQCPLLGVIPVVPSADGDFRR